MGTRPKAFAVAVMAVIALQTSISAAPFTLARMTDTVALTSNTFTVASSFDTVAPTVSATVIAKTGGYFASFIKQAGTYQVYANASDGGSPASGIATITANVSTITTGQTAVPLAAGSYSVEGVSYGWRSATLTASNPLTAGSQTYSLTSTDNNANVRTQSGFTVTVDNTAPSGADIQTANGGATVGKIELGDRITFTFSEIIDPQSIQPGWTGASTNVVVRFANSGNADTYTIWNGANTTQLNLGTAATKGNYVTAATTAGATGTASTMVLDTATKTITLVLGTITGTVVTDAGNNNEMWTPVATAFDRAGVVMSTTVTNESGTSDPDF